MPPTSPSAVAVVALILLFALMLLGSIAVMLVFSPWIQAMLSGVPLRVLDLIGMRLRRTDIRAVVRALILAKRGRVYISCAEMESAWVQGVNLEKVTLAMIQASKESLGFTFQELVDAERRDRLAELLAGKQRSSTTLSPV